MSKKLEINRLINSSIPTIEWKEYIPNTKFDEEYLWTIRIIPNEGSDTHLPKRVGCTASEAEYFAKQSYVAYRDIGKVIYYPYFIAKKSGILSVDNEGYSVEAVNGDLWSLVNSSKFVCTYKRDRKGNVLEYEGREDFLSDYEIKELHKQVDKIREEFRWELSNNSTKLVLEWSYIADCDRFRREIIGPYLVFYEVKTALK